MERQKGNEGNTRQKKSQMFIVEKWIYSLAPRPNNSQSAAFSLELQFTKFAWKQRI